MAYVHRPHGDNYYEADRTVIREAPYGGTYNTAQYTVDQYGNRVYQHRNSLGNEVTEIVSEVVPDRHHQHHYPHHHGRPVEYIERSEERIVEGAYDPYRRIY